MNSTEPRFPFVAVDVEPDDADVMSATLFELGAQGVEERDGTTLVKGTSGKATLVASFETLEEAKQAIEALDPSCSPRIEEIVGDAWRDAWKEHFKPFTICQGLVIRPPWEAYSPAEGEDVLELEPGRAFGTGLHETTSLVAGAIQSFGESALAGARVLDVGCGSGILALVALKLGASSARCIDNDPDAIEVTRENAERNGMSSLVQADTTDVDQLQDTFPIVCANIEARVLIPMANALSARVTPGGLLILSGILVHQKDSVCAAYETFNLLSAPIKGEWIALVLRAPAKSR